MDQAEHDPTGRSAHEPGAKLDAGKPRPALVLGGFARALSAVTEVGTYGAQKYTDNGWRTVPDGVERYSEAMLRHWLSEAKGEQRDLDTKLLHAAHLAWNALARLELMLSDSDKGEQVVAQKFMLTNVWRDDRWPTEGDADSLKNVWVWDDTLKMALKVHWGNCGSHPWINGDAPRPTQPPARQGK